MTTKESNENSCNNSSLDASGTSLLGAKVWSFAKKAGFHSVEYSVGTCDSLSNSAFHCDGNQNESFNQIFELIKTKEELIKLSASRNILEKSKFSQGFIDSNCLEKKALYISNLCKHLDELIQKKDLIIQVLQKPVTSDSIVMHHDHQKFVLEFVHYANYLMKNLNICIKDYEWMMEKDWTKNYTELKRLSKASLNSIAELNQPLFRMKSLRNDLFKIINIA